MLLLIVQELRVEEELSICDLHRVNIAEYTEFSYMKERRIFSFRNFKSFGCGVGTRSIWLGERLPLFTVMNTFLKKPPSQAVSQSDVSSGDPNDKKFELFH